METREAHAIMATYCAVCLVAIVMASMMAFGGDFAFARRLNVVLDTRAMRLL